MVDIHNLFVYLPPDRMYGHDAVTPLEQSPIVGMVYEKLLGENGLRSIYYPFGQRPAAPRWMTTNRATEGYDLACYLPLARLPLVPLGRSVKLTEVQELLLLGAPPGRGYLLKLAERDWRDRSRLEQIPQRTLAQVGLVAGRVYTVAELVVPDSAVRLVGIPGVYYAGIFESRPAPAPEDQR